MKKKETGALEETGPDGGKLQKRPGGLRKILKGEDQTREDKETDWLSKRTKNELEKFKGEGSRTEKKNLTGEEKMSVRSSPKKGRGH